MKTLVIGATGKIGSLLVPKLIGAGHETVALIRNTAKAEPLRKLGTEIRIADIESSFESALEGVKAVVFTAGSGASTGKDKTLTVDLWGAIQAIRNCEALGIRRFVMVSALKAQNPNLGSEGLKPYLVAKHAADEILAASSLDYTILRPGPLTDDAATGRISVAEQLEDVDGSITREDVAECIVRVLDSPHTIGKAYDLLNGGQAISESPLAR